MESIKPNFKKNSTGIILFIFIFFFIFFSLNNYCPAKEVNEYMKIFNEAGSFFQKAEYRKAIAKYKKGLELCEKTGKKKKSVAFLGRLAACHQNLGEPQKAAEYFEKAEKIAIEINNKNLQMAAARETGGLKQDQ